MEDYMEDEKNKINTPFLLHEIERELKGHLFEELPERLDRRTFSANRRSET